MKKIIILIILCLSFNILAERGVDKVDGEEAHVIETGAFADLNIGYFTGEIGSTDYDGFGFSFHFGPQLQEKYYLGAFINMMAGSDVASFTAGITAKYAITNRINVLAGYSLYSKADDDTSNSEVSDANGFFLGGEYIFARNWSVKIEYHKLSYDEAKNNQTGVTTTGVDIDSNYTYLAINWLI